VVLLLLLLLLLLPLLLLGPVGRYQGRLCRARRWQQQLAEG
jgi:hypothetical protein